MSTKKQLPKKSVKKDPMTLPKKIQESKSKESGLVFKSPIQNPATFNDCCEKEPDNYDRDAELMKSAARQIRGLQDTTRIQANRLDMFDKCYNLFTGNNRQNGGDCCGQDIAYSLERRADERIEELMSSKQQL